MSAYAALAEPHRRQILDLVRLRERSVTDLVAHLGLSQPGVSKHLKVLREAGLVAARTHGKQRLYAVQPEPLVEIAQWLEPYRMLWSHRLDALERRLGGEPMTDGTLETIDGRPALRFERVLAHPIEGVWRAVSVPGELEQWFPAAADWTPAVGEVFEAGGMQGEVTEATPPHRLAWTFGGDSYAFDLAERDGVCLLVFTHVFDDRAIAAQTAAGWDAYLSRLAPHLAGGQLSETESHGGWADVHERYAARFAVDPEPGRRFAAQLRTER